VVWTWTRRHCSSGCPSEATGVPLFTIWDSVAGPGRTPMPGNNFRTPMPGNNFCSPQPQTFSPLSLFHLGPRATTWRLESDGGFCLFISQVHGDLRRKYGLTHPWGGREGVSGARNKAPPTADLGRGGPSLASAPISDVCSYN